jgi:hypothetical protein
MYYLIKIFLYFIHILPVPRYKHDLNLGNFLQMFPKSLMREALGFLYGDSTSATEVQRVMPLLGFDTLISIQFIPYTAQFLASCPYTLKFKITK